MAGQEDDTDRARTHRRSYPRSRAGSLSGMDGENGVEGWVREYENMSAGRMIHRHAQLFVNAYRRRAANPSAHVVCPPADWRKG